MANDPERDLLPVKDGVLCERQRNVSTFSLNTERDKLHSPYISKLDRKELEDRYMCLMVDNSHLKRECNKQEEKIKRLATKLLRLVAEQKRDLPTAVQRHDYGLESLVQEQQQQIRELQQSNGQLQDRLMVLRNQLVEHTYMHSAVHCNWMRKSHSSSRPPTRSHTGTYMPSSRMRSAVSSNDPQNMFQPNSQSDILDIRNKEPHQPLGSGMVEEHPGLNDEQRPPEVPNNNVAVAPQNQKLSEETMRLHEQISILEQGLETQREQSSARIGELEDELANTVAQNQQQKVAENVEMIRLQRSLQQQSAHLAAQSAKNQVLEREVAHLRQELETKQQDNDELHHQLMNEHRKVADLQQELQGVASNCLSVRELQEQIRDIQNERSTLKEHNERLLALMSSRQTQGSEQEVALRSQVSQLENILSKERSEHAMLMQQIEQLQLEVQDHAHLRLCAGQERALRIQVAQLEAALSKELKEKSSMLETQNEMRQKMPETQLSSDTENALRSQVTQLETKLSKEMSDRAQILQSLEEERTQVAALKVSHSDLLVRLQDLQAQHAKIESQLQTIQQEKLTCEEGSQISDDLSRLKIPEHDSWQNDELNMMDSHPGDDQSMTANQLDVYCELEKCRELLRVQYNLNSMYKKEVASLAQQLNQSEGDHAKKMDEMSNLLQKYATHITELQTRLRTSEIHHTAQYTGHLTIGVGEGLFEIHIQSLQLSPEGLGSLMDEPFGTVYQNKEPASLFLTWEFYDQDVAYTPVKAAETCIEFDSSSVHRVTVNDEFLQYLEEESCTIEVHMAVDDASETVARGSLHFSDLLRFPQKKFRSTVPLAGTRSCDTIYEFGIIKCWFILSCSDSLVSSFIQHRTTKKVTRTKLPVPAPRQKKGQTSTGISHLVDSITPDNSVSEEQVQPEEYSTKDKTEERVNTKVVPAEDKLEEGTAEGSPEGEKGPVEGNPEGTSADDIQDFVQVEEETPDSKESDSSKESGKSRQVCRTEPYSRLGRL